MMGDSIIAMSPPEIQKAGSLHVSGYKAQYSRRNDTRFWGSRQAYQSGKLPESFHSSIRRATTSFLMVSTCGRRLYREP